MAAPNRKTAPSRALQPPVQASAPKTPASAQLSPPRCPSATGTGTASSLASKPSSLAKPADGNVVLIDVPEGAGVRWKRPSVTFGSPVIFSSGSGVTVSEKAKKHQQKVHRSINRPSELPMLRMPRVRQKDVLFKSGRATFLSCLSSISVAAVGAAQASRRGNR